MSVTLTLLYFASLRERVGAPSESLSTEAADLAGLYEEIQARHGIAWPREHLRVAGPAGPLALGAVGGQVQEIALHAPNGVVMQLVDQRIRAFKGARRRHVAVDGHRAQVFRFWLAGVTLQQDIAETMHGKVRLILFFPFAFQCIVHLLEEGHFLGRKDEQVGHRKVAIPVQRFPVPQANGRSFWPAHSEMHYPCQVLPKVEHGFPVRRLDDLGLEGFLAPHRDTH